MSEFVPDGEAVGEGVEPAPSPAPAEEDSIAEELKSLVAERTEDLQRIQAEYANYKKRVDRDRALARQAGIEQVVTDLMPVLDSLALARSHGDMEGGFKLIADEFEKVTTKYGLVAFGQVGDAFDPQFHEALLQMPLDAPVEVATVSQVMQPGYQMGERVLRPARVAVAQPDAAAE